MQTHEAEASGPPKHSLSVTNHKRISHYPRAIDRGASKLDVGARRHRQSTARVLWLSTASGECDMETSSHLQHRSRPLWAKFPPEQRADRPKPVAAPLRRPTRLLREEPTDTVAARLESTESFGATPNSYPPSSMPACDRRLPARQGLAAWQQLVAAAYIKKPIAEPIRIRALARFVYLSPHCFCRAFKQSFGMPPHRYLVQQRIGRAKAMLARSGYSISEIGLALGFSQISSFSAAFRHVTGLSPTEYRRTQQ